MQLASANRWQAVRLRSRPHHIGTLACPRRQANANSRGLCQPERHHEGHGGELQRNAMRGKLNRPDPAHHERGNGEEADFRQNHQADRNAKPHHLAQRLPVRPPEAGVNRP